MPDGMPDGIRKRMAWEQELVATILGRGNLRNWKVFYGIPIVYELRNHKH